MSLRRASVASAVPVLMLHSTAPPDRLAPHRWLQRLATPPELLERTFSEWRRRGIRTLGSAELAAFLAGRLAPPSRSVVLTLDDGYVDNWIALTPLLEAYGLKAIVFVSTDFVDPRPIVRPRNTAGAAPPELDWKGYLSWDEMRAAEGSGCVEIQSHAKTHTWYFVSDRIVDYYRPANALTGARSRLRFLWLNANPDRKPFALAEMRDDSVRWGTPVYEFAPALVARRFTPDVDETEIAVDLVARNGGAAFFERRDWKERLDAAILGRRTPGRDTGTYETESERAARILDELRSSRELISARLGHAVDFLSFPQGGMDADGERIAADAGYAMWTMPSRAGSRAATRADGPHRVFRCGSGYSLFGESSRTGVAMVSHRISLERHFGAPWARTVTSTVGAARRLAKRLGVAR